MSLLLLKLNQLRTSQFQFIYNFLQVFGFVEVVLFNCLDFGLIKSPKLILDSRV